jgi:deoxyribodipyrimidine photo-lyase
MTVLPRPVQGREVAWVRTHLSHLCCDEPQQSPRFLGTQAAADEALRTFKVAGYANRRNEVFPFQRRGASGLSPWIRHGFLSLPEMWSAVDGPSRDVEKFRDELLWQEYARHVYARVGPASKNPFRYVPRSRSFPSDDPWDRSMACIDLALSELEVSGWMVNQTRMWLASHWTVRHELDWRAGEDVFFRHLLDGSRAANRVGWQWTIGAATGKPYGFSRWQVNKRAPGLCNTCTHCHNCPIEGWPNSESLQPTDTPNTLKSAFNIDDVAGPSAVAHTTEPDIVWITAESLGDSDPAMEAHPNLPVIFVFDEPLLRKLQLSGKRLVFLTERLAEVAATRDISIELGAPTQVLKELRVATTFAPVPGWRTITNEVPPAVVHPWPWLRRPGSGSIASFSAWRDRTR